MEADNRKLPSLSSLMSAIVGAAQVIAYLIPAIAIIVGAQIGAGLAGSVAGRWMTPLLQGVLGIAGILLFTWIARVKIIRRPWSGMALKGPLLTRWLAGAAAGTICVVALCAIEWCLGWLHLAKIDMSSSHGLPKAAWLVLALAPSVSVGFIEELAFRGFIFQTLAERMRTWSAALIMSLVFGLAHFNLAGFGIGFVASVLILSMTFLVLRFATGSLWFPIGFHGAWDYGQTYLIGVSTTGLPGQDPSLVQVVQSGPLLWVGGNPSIEGGLLCILLFSAVLVAALLFGARTGRLPPWRRQLSVTGQ